MHSIWSDGAETLESIVNACLERGWSCAGVTDHSYGLPIAGGMSMHKAIEQHRAIDRVNAAHDGRFRLLKGVEANIRADGSIDMEPAELRLFDPPEELRGALRFEGTVPALRNAGKRLGEARGISRHMLLGDPTDQSSTRSSARARISSDTA